MQPTDLRVLCLEEDPDVRHIIRLALALDGSIVTRNVSDEAGIMAEVARGFNPHVLLLSDDKSTGILARLILRLGPEAPAVIVLTTNNRERTVNRLEAGAAGVIVKPFDPLTFATSVRSLIVLHTSTRLMV